MTRTVNGKDVARRRRKASGLRGRADSGVAGSDPSVVVNSPVVVRMSWAGSGEKCHQHEASLAVAHDRGGGGCPGPVRLRQRWRYGRRFRRVLQRTFLIRIVQQQLDGRQWLVRYRLLGQ